MASFLKDTLEREISYLRISVTDRCNLKCVYCAPERGLKPFRDEDCLTAQEILRIAGLFVELGVRKVRLTGGEPLAYPGIERLVSGIKGMGVRELGLTTNGTSLASRAPMLKQAGLDRVNISLDTLNNDRYATMTRGGKLSLALEGIEAAETSGLRPVKINMVPIIGFNDKEVPDFAALTLQKDYHIRFIELMPSRQSEKVHLLPLRYDEIMRAVSKVGELVPIEHRGNGPSRNYRLRGGKGVIGFISPLSDHFCGSCNRLRLTASGEIRPCLFSGRKVNLRDPMREGASDEEVKYLIREAVRNKPAGGHKGPADGLPVPMLKVGG